MNLPSGNFTQPSMSLWGIGDNQISQIIPAANTEVEIFAGATFNGGSRLVRASTCLSGGFNNVTSSLTIRASIVQFKDDFNSGSLANWRTAEGTWSVVNGTMVGVGGGGLPDGAAYVTPNRTFNGTTVVDADVDTVGGQARFIMNSTGSAPRENEYHLMVYSSVWTGEPAYTNSWQIVGFRNFSYEFPNEGLPGVRDGVMPVAMTIPRKFHYTARRLGNKFDYYVNWVRIGSITVPNALPATGNVGAGVIWTQTAGFDNFVVRN